MIEFKLPSLGADMDEGTLLRWQVKPGDHVKRGQVVAVVDTSKAAVDVEIWNDGVIADLRVQAGEKVPVGTVLATLEATDQAATAAPPQRQAITPGARKRAKELGLDPLTLHGTGALGAVTLADVQAAAGVAPAALPASERQKEMRRAIAAAMSRSKREIPHYYLTESIPMDAAMAWLQQCNASLPVTERILVAVLQLKAVALVMQHHQPLNGFYRDGVFQPANAVHTGVAIALRDGGLVAPALHDVQTKPLDQLMRELADLVKRARAGSLRSSEMSDPTLTVTNLGDQGVELVLGVIYPPQVSLVGFGRIAQRPWAQDGGLRVCSMVTATLAADHRVSDGHQGALFLAELRDLLQEPEKWAPWSTPSPTSTTPP